MKKILIVEDESKIAEAIEAYLQKEGYLTIIANDGKAAISLFDKELPDLMILDLMLPFISGEEVCKIVRKKSSIPMIMLTAKVSEEQKIEGLNIGADDYMTKPFSPRELVARVNCLFRRCGEGKGQTSYTTSWNHKDLEVNYSTHRIKKQGKEINLTQSEFKIFATLAKNPNKIFTRNELIDIAFGMDYDGFDRTIDSHIKNIRSKIETDTANPIYILTIRGIGYRFGGENN